MRRLAALVLAGTAAAACGADLPPVLAAARDGDTVRLAKLLDADPKLLEARDDSRGGGGTPLDWAAGFGHRPAVELLLTRGADVNARTRGGRTPVMGVKDCDPDIVRLLIARGADVRAASERGHTLLQHAALHGRTELMTELLAKGVDVNAASDLGTPLHYAVLGERVPAAELLLAHKAKTEGRDRDGRTPLHAAVERPVDGMVELLLKEGADVNAAVTGSDQRPLTGMTPLHLALQSGPTPGTALRPGRMTPLAGVALLLDRGAAVDRAAAEGVTPLHLAARRDAATVRAVLARKPAVNAGDRVRATPLHVAAGRSDQEAVEVVRRLLAAGATVDARTADDFRPHLPRPGGFTPLHMAAGAGNVAVIGELLKHGADVNARSTGRQTPLDRAEKGKHADAVAALKAAGA